MDFILEYKWLFLIMGEVVFTLCAAAFLLLRYWYQLEKLSIIVFIIFLVNDLWIAFLAVMDYQRTGEFSWYQIIAVVFILYALTLGKSDMKKLDEVIKRKVAEKRGVTVE
ncbi:MAG: hypothetical protein ABS942_06245 [Solibacillus sp.]|uniref:hypothetical protein n=1 Tax=unclassified Solibacillus TaxID=2637870 RepID=UPI003100EE8E